MYFEVISPLRHCEHSEATQGGLTPLWIAAPLRGSQ
jgi:hypothetical protein